jgi:DNA-binding MarR family transcriptional regulator
MAQPLAEAPTSTPPIDDVLAAFGELVVAQRRLRGRDARHSEGLTFAQVRLLNALEDDAGCSAREIADRAGMTAASVSEMLDYLEQAGIVTRSRSTLDRRVVVTRLTPTGRTLRDARRDEVKRTFARQLEGLEQDELTAAAGVIRLLASTIEAL